MSNDDGGTLNPDVHLSDDDNSAPSLGSRVSDDSGIEDWSDDMTIHTESQDGMQPKDFSGDASTPELMRKPVSPIKEENSSDCLSTVELPTINDSFRKDILADAGISGACGLNNLGNTCFMNAALQCVFVTLPLKNLVLEGDILHNGSDHMDEPANVLLFVERFQELYHKVLSGKYSVLHPAQLHLSVARLHSVFGDYKQHDSQEFLSFLLNTLHDLLNKASARNRLTNNLMGETSLKNTDSSHYTCLSDDVSENITGEVSKRLKMDSDIELNNPMDTDAGVECEESLSKAESAWRKYTAENQSVIVDSFQGQFQSVIICEKCAFISTTYEPFMFLSLPIPYAMEKQLVICWIPSPRLCPLPGMVSAVKYCVTVKKSSCILDVKNAFLSLVKKSDAHINMKDIVLAEVDRSANVNILDDRTQIAYLSKKKSIYAIEVIHEYQRNSSSENSHQSLYNDDYLHRSDALHIQNDDSNGKEMLKNERKYSCGNGYELGLAPDCEGDPESVNSNIYNKDENNFGASAAAWHSCGICLEEVFDEELKVHLICGGTLCDSCLSRLVQGNTQQRFPCPICSRYISLEEYTPLLEPKKNGEVKKCVRQVMVPIMFRHDSTNNNECNRKYHLFGHPVICLLPSHVESGTVLDQVNQVLLSVSHFPVKFDVIVTNGAGLSCGLCDILSSCTGCKVKDGEMLQLKPGSCLSIHFHDNIDMVVKTMNMFLEDKSMKELRESDTVLLKECLSKFGDTELLSNENPWFCPQCQTNQMAVKNMTVTRWPDTLIIHLKRFYFEGHQGCKITCPVDFPLNDLNVDILTCADGDSDSLKMQTGYDLYAFICHCGTLFGGHYTAMIKANPSAEWHFFNDESFQKMAPIDEHKEEGYVLFYQRKGS